MKNRGRNGDPPREVELKLGLPSAAAHSRLRAALDAAGGFVRAVRQENLFLEGTHDELTAARLALRVRIEQAAGPAQRFLTLKAGGVTAGAVSDRAEWECSLPVDLELLRARPSCLLALDLEPVLELRRLVPELTELLILGGFCNDRRVYRVLLDRPGLPAPASGTAHRIESIWELDRSEFPDGSIDHELEVELGGLGPPEVLIAAIRAELARVGVPTVAQPKSKYARFRERTRI